jgi:hypothetical protein
MHYRASTRRLASALVARAAQAEELFAHLASRGADPLLKAFLHDIGNDRVIKPIYVAQLRSFVNARLH